MGTWAAPLAIAAKARWLLSHDRAVLKLARPLRALGTEVTTPAAWSTACETR